MADHRTLEPHEFELLQTFAAANGRNWKTKLAAQWEAASAAPDLQALRNTHGPAWLKSFAFFAAAKAYCQGLGFTLTKTGEGEEVRLNKPNGREAEAYYTTDLLDAIGTCDHIHDGPQYGAKLAADPSRR